MSPVSALFANIFLAIFLFGLVFTVLSVVLGVSHIGAVGSHDGGLAVGHHAHLDVGNQAAGHADVQVGGDGSGPDAAIDSLSVLNMPTIMAFMTWFGGAGYIVMHTIGWGAFIAVPLALLSGFSGGTMMFLLLARVLWPMRSRPMSSEDYSLPGTRARVVSSIREGGVGEIVYSKAGSRFTAGARAADNQPIAKGAEVVIIEYERGLAYVDPVADTPRMGVE